MIIVSAPDAASEERFSLGLSSPLVSACAPGILCAV
jgi:hypothetical protein